MKFLFISDLHGSLYYSKKIDEIYEKENPDYIVFLGDLLYHGARNPLTREYDPKEVVEILNKYKYKVIGVRGNCDSEVDRMLIKFDMEATYTNIFIDGVRIYATHGHIYNFENLPKINEGDVFIQGHTHIPLAEEKHGIYFINPGSITLPKGGSENSYSIYENREFRIKNIEGRTMKSLKIK